MPANSRKGRGFGGSLLTKPQALPDDDDDAPEEQVPPSPTPARVEAVQAAPEPVLSDQPAMPRQSVAPVEEREEPAVRPVAPQKQTPEKKPPGTLRLNEVAGAQLWDAYLEAKELDHFLSYRKFASDVILDGLATHKRRQKRT